MKKSILMGLGVCALALGGVAALVGQRGAVETNAYDKSDTTWYMAGSFRTDNENWVLNASELHFTYEKVTNNNWEFVSDQTITIPAGERFKIVYSWDNGANANYFSPQLLQNSVDFYKNTEGGDIYARRDITATFYFQIYSQDSGASKGTGLYWGETASSKLAAANAFATTFLSATSEYCTGSVSAETQASLKTAYDNLGGAKNAFYEAGVVRGKGVSYSSLAQEALSRYVNMQEDKGYTDFLSLGDENPANPSRNVLPSISSSSNDSLGFAIALGSSLAVAMGIGIAIIKRRKERE